MKETSTSTSHHHLHHPQQSHQMSIQSRCLHSTTTKDHSITKRRYNVSQPHRSNNRHDRSTPSSHHHSSSSLKKTCSYCPKDGHYSTECRNNPHKDLPVTSVDDKDTEKSTVALSDNEPPFHLLNSHTIHPTMITARNIKLMRMKDTLHLLSSHHHQHRQYHMHYIHQYHLIHGYWIVQQPITLPVINTSWLTHTN